MRRGVAYSNSDAPPCTADPYLPPPLRQPQCAERKENGKTGEKDTRKRKMEKGKRLKKEGRRTMGRKGHERERERERKTERDTERKRGRERKMCKGKRLKKAGRRKMGRKGHEKEKDGKLTAPPSGKPSMSTASLGKREER
jgi:hypothetical protein